MTTVENCIQIIGEAGYREIGHFTLPEAAWRDDYYRPMQMKFPTLSTKHQDNPTALMIIDEAQHEIEMYRANSDYYGYVFFVMQRESFHAHKPGSLG
jgi:hypothetical protein